MQHEQTKGEPHRGNWYILVSGLSLGVSPLPMASGLTLRELDAPLSVFDLAAAGAVGFREWATLQPFAAVCTAELESAADAAGVGRVAQPFGFRPHGSERAAFPHSAPPEGYPTRAKDTSRG